MQSSSENRKCGQKEATAKTMEICCEELALDTIT